MLLPPVKEVGWLEGRKEEKERRVGGERKQKGDTSRLKAH